MEKNPGIINVLIQNSPVKEPDLGQRPPAARVAFMIKQFETGRYIEGDLEGVLGRHLSRYPEYKYQVPSSVTSKLYGEFTIRLIDK